MGNPSAAHPYEVYGSDNLSLAKASNLNVECLYCQCLTSVKASFQFACTSQKYNHSQVNLYNTAFESLKNKGEPATYLNIQEM